MSSGTSAAGNGGHGQAAGGGRGKPAKKERNRKAYDHHMNDAERFALQTVRQAKKAATLLAIGLQEGSGITPEAMQACTALVNASSNLLFAD